MLRKLLKLEPAFQVNIAFFLILVIVVLINYKSIPNSFNLLIIFVSMIVLQIYLCTFKESRTLKPLRKIFFPTFSVMLAFDTVGYITPYINSDIDHLLLKLDYEILGFYPYLYLQTFVNPILTEIMQISYCVYYFLPFMIGFYLLYRNQIKDFYKVLFLILLCYYLSYVGYILFPALGPRYSIQGLFEVELQGVFLAESINRFLNSLEGIKRDAFPSGHVGISLLVLILFHQYSKKIFSILLLPVFLLILSTIYCRYHYFVDVLAGFLLTFVTLVFGKLYYNFWQRTNEDSLYKKSR